MTLCSLCYYVDKKMRLLDKPELKLKPYQVRFLLQWESSSTGYHAKTENFSLDPFLYLRRQLISVKNQSFFWQTFIDVQAS